MRICRELGVKFMHRIEYVDLAKLTRIDRVFQFAQIIEQILDGGRNNAPQRVVVDSQVTVY